MNLLAFTNVLFLRQMATMENNIINDKITDLAYSIQESLQRYKQGEESATQFDSLVYEIVANSHIHNSWFVPSQMLFAIDLFVSDLQYITNNNLISQLNDIVAAGSLEKDIQEDINAELNKQHQNNFSRKLACLLRTEAPFEGIALLLLLSASGYECTIKVEARLQHLLKNILALIELKFNKQFKISQTESRFNEIGALLAFADLGETAKEYFEKYQTLQLFSKGKSYIINGSESDDLLNAIATMICMYFGRGENSIKVLFITEHYNMERLKAALEKYSDLLLNNRYYNNYEYRKSAMIINHLDYSEIGPLLITNNANQAGYTSVLCIQEYREIHEIFSNKLIDQYPLINSIENAPNSGYTYLSLSTFLNSYHKVAPFIRELHARRAEL